MKVDSKIFNYLNDSKRNKCRADQKTTSEHTFYYTVMHVSVIGAGGWGTALAFVLANNGHQTTLWGRDANVVRTINTEHINPVYLPGVHIHEGIEATIDAVYATSADVIVIAIPTQFIRPTLEQYQLDVRDKIIVNVSKGIEQHSLLRISQVMYDIAGTSADDYVVLTGPSHAEEVCRRMPTTVVAASTRQEQSKLVQSLFNSDVFRVYTSPDVIGAEIGGAVKNVIAIAAGAIDGLGLGDNTKAALITRGLAEISRLGVALGANPLTFAGLSGLGDLVVTCASKHSRNRRVGEMLGKGMTMEEINSTMKQVAEGVFSTQSVHGMALQLGIEMPITENMFEMIFQGRTAQEALRVLMTRQSKSEHWW
jgi:glycerol-3-phosphate dehydrogenase (NAD(P)+)